MRGIVATIKVKEGMAKDFEEAAMKLLQPSTRTSWTACSISSTAPMTNIPTSLWNVTRTRPRQSSTVTPTILRHLAPQWALSWRAAPMSSAWKRLHSATTMDFRIERLSGPIIVPNMDARMGTNINGPSLIRAPDWLPTPPGRYLLYFAHHNGTYIRLAFADAIEGPWRTHEAGVLD